MDNQRLPNSDPKSSTHTYTRTAIPKSEPRSNQMEISEIIYWFVLGLERGRRGGAPHRPHGGGLVPGEVVGGDRQTQHIGVLPRRNSLVEDSGKEGSPLRELRVEDDGSQIPPWPASSPARPGGRLAGQPPSATRADLGRRLREGQRYASGGGSGNKNRLSSARDPTGRISRIRKFTL
jgi:hypothetical protein